MKDKQFLRATTDNKYSKYFKDSLPSQEDNHYKKPTDYSINNTNQGSNYLNVNYKYEGDKPLSRSFMAEHKSQQKYSYQEESKNIRDNNLRKTTNQLSANLKNEFKQVGKLYGSKLDVQKDEFDQKIRKYSYDHTKTESKSPGSYKKMIDLLKKQTNYEPTTTTAHSNNITSPILYTPQSYLTPKSEKVQYKQVQSKSNKIQQLLQKIENIDKRSKSPIQGNNNSTQKQKFSREIIEKYRNYLSPASLKEYQLDVQSKKMAETVQITINNQTAKKEDKEQDRNRFAFKKQQIQITKQKSPQSQYDEKFPFYISKTKIQISPDINLMPKLSVNDFEFGKNKGQGKFGVVFCVRHKNTKSLYALKKIQKSVIKTNMMQQQLQLQIKLQAYFNHPNILRLYGFFDDKDYVYLLLEYMEGGTLFENMKRRKDKILEEQVTQKVRDITQGVKYLHSLNIAHRDIKPENIVLSHGVAKLCDFGWSTRCENRRTTFCGTFDFAAPQILEGKQYDWCVDLWCVGVLTYEMLTGKVPFYNISRKQTMRKILEVDKHDIEYPSDMSWEAKDFIGCLIKKEPHERMTASQLLEHAFLKKYQKELLH